MRQGILKIFDKQVNNIFAEFLYNYTKIKFYY